MRHFLMQKNIGFFEIYGVSARTRGLIQCGYFSDKGGRVNLSRFCAEILYERPLTENILIVLHIVFFNTG